MNIGRWPGAMDQSVGPGFESDKKQRENCQSNLKTLRATLFRTDFTFAPLR
jgi:hypothetical protein